MDLCPFWCDFALVFCVSDSPRAGAVDHDLGVASDHRAYLEYETQLQ